MGDTIVFTGYKDRAQTPFLFAASDLTVVPSIWHEGPPLVILESMATGVPVIGSCRGGIPEVIDHEIDGLLIKDPEDIRSLADHILKVLQNHAYRQEMGKLAHEKISKHFTLSIKLECIQKIYENLAKI